MKSLRFIAIGCLLLCAILYVGCQKEEGLGGKSLGMESPMLLTVFQDELFDLTFEVETFTRIKTDDPLNSDLDKLTAHPIVGKHKVSMSVRTNGDLNLEIENMTPGISIPIPNNALPNNMPIPHKTVIENGTVTLYAANGTQLHSSPVEPLKMAHMSSIVSAVRSGHTAQAINQAVAGMQSQMYGASLNAMLANPSAYGVTVSQVNQSVFSIRMPAAATGIPGFDGEAVLLVDKDRNLLLATKLYGRNGEPQMCMMINYDEGESATAPTIKAIRQEVMETLPSGALAIMEMVSTIENLQFTVN